MVDRAALPSPYVGPRPFETQHQDRFFGRRGEVNELLSLVFAERVLLIYAQSGAGKTSLVNAGLIPALEAEGFEVLPPARVWGRVDTGPFPGYTQLTGTHLITSIPSPAGPVPLSIAPVDNPYLASILLGWARWPVDHMQLGEKSLAGFLGEREHRTDEMGLPAPRAVILDQFEELFTSYAEYWEKREHLIRELAAALQADPVLRVILVMREDYIAQLDPYASILPGKLRARYRLERLRRDAALAAVTGPLPEGYAFAEGVAEQLVEDLLRIQIQRPSGETISVKGEFVEPVQLQVVCQSLWQALPAGVAEITPAHLQAYADVNEALARFYERALETTGRETGVSEGDLRAWFERALITPAGTRGTVFRDAEATGDLPNAAVDVLENLHLIRGEQRAGSRWYELTHDRLIEPILDANARQREQVREQRTARSARWKTLSSLVFFGWLAALMYLFPWLEEMGVWDTGEAAISNFLLIGTMLAFGFFLIAFWHDQSRGKAKA